VCPSQLTNVARISTFVMHTGKWANKRIQEKYNIMAGLLLLKIPNMKRKDPRRDFSEKERYAIYLKAKQNCAKCGNRTKFEEGDADHQIRHTDGGPTSLANARWLCRKHNRSNSKLS
jgi:hypothetical protein